MPRPGHTGAGVGPARLAEPDTVTGREDRAGAESGSQGGDLVSRSGTVETHRHAQYDSLVTVSSNS